MYPYGSLGVPLESPWSQKVMIHWQNYSDTQDIWRETRCILLHFQDFTEITIYRFSTFLMSGPLAQCQICIGYPQLAKVTSRDQGLQNWTGFTWNIIKLMNSRFALGNSQKGTVTKMAEKLSNFEKNCKKKIRFQPCSQPRDLLMTGQMP